MDKRSALLPIAVALVMVMAWGAQALAVDCGEPMAAPKYQVGDKWTWKDDKGRESTDEVIQVEGEVAQIKWSNGDVAYYDKDRILRQVKRRTGEMVTTQTPQYSTIGQKTMDFPLQVGKEWSYSRIVPQTSTGEMQTYIESYEVVACEEVSTPAAKFASFKIEVQQRNVKLGSSGTRYFWYAPQVKNSVRSQYVPSRYWSNPVDTELIKFEVR